MLRNCTLDAPVGATPPLWVSIVAVKVTDPARGRIVELGEIPVAVEPFVTVTVIEGPFAVGDRVAIVEDVITTGASALRAAESVREAGGVIVGVLALVDREEGGRQAIESKGLPVLALVGAAEIVAHMEARGGGDGHGRKG